jgi:hypothetical protein
VVGEHGEVVSERRRGGATLCGIKRGDQGGEASQRSNFSTF